MSKIKIPDSREGWLKLRQQGLGGSDAGVVLGFSPYKSPYALWAEKTGIIPASDTDNETLRQGRDLEEYVARRFCEATGKRVKKSSFMYRSDEHPWMLGTVDRLVIGEKAGLECKTAGMLSASKFEGGNVPANYYAQCMHYMECTGLRKWYIAILIFQKDFIIYEIDYDPAWAAQMVAAEEDFWNRVLEGSAPDLDGSASTAAALTARYPKSISTVLKAEENDELESAAEQYQELDGRIKELKERQELIKNTFRSWMEEAETALTESFRISWKAQSRTTVNTKKLKEKYPDVYEDVRKQTASRPMKIDRRKEEK